eukprot:CAMPEP_0113579266 /NCGR_PEP_ID=MMETSP0015_2-20120614/29975_1 /TAXON_ID=2838 /ORGANISM="Odontella" /LENGTH=511 /DNA_ID=CAMNT_0000483231 /DNA_START=61 /DNA_END=1596 /DNA_ORIENTATION=+ /assembly_acc=CAM_ASM_000160
MARMVIGCALLFVGLSLYAGVAWWSALYYFEIHEMHGAGPGPPMLPPLTESTDPGATAHEPPGRSYGGTRSLLRRQEDFNDQDLFPRPVAVSDTSAEEDDYKLAQPLSKWRSSRYTGGGEGGEFPRRGSSSFDEQCAWTAVVPEKKPEQICTILARPDSGESEGISAWLSLTIMDGYMLARQSGCRLLLDYGEVDILSVLEPPLTMELDGDVNENVLEGVYNWTVPRDFHCEAHDLCFNKFSGPHRERRMRAQSLGELLNVSGLVDAPAYRFAAYRQPFHNDSAMDVQRKLPGFHLETGLACVLANTIRLAPTASDFEPRLFTNILPRMKDPDALVLALYVRTGFTDLAKWSKRKGMNVTAKIEGFFDIGRKVFDCGVALEQRYTSGNLADVQKERKSLSNIVWVVLSDSPAIKKYAVRNYNNRPVTEDGNNITRTVLITGSQGTHTRSNRSPSTADFAGAFIDWFLIGESDLVVHDRWDTFGPTAGMRTSRPIYNADSGCKRRLFIQTAG